MDKTYTHNKERDSFSYFEEEDEGVEFVVLSTEVHMM